MLRKITILLILLVTSTCQAGYVKPVRGQIFVDRGNLRNRKLLADWRMNEGTGGGINDSSGNMNVGVLQSTTSWAVGERGLSLSFNGSSDYVDFGDVLDMGTNNFSLMFWMKAATDLTTATSGGRVIQKRGTGSFGSFAGWGFTVRRDGTVLRVDNGVFDDGASGIALFDLANMGQVLGQWIHVSITINRSTGTAKLYVDTVLMDTDDISSITGSVDNARNLTLGASDVSLTQFFKGELARVRFYGQDLSLSDIYADYRNSINDYFPHRTGVLIYDVGVAPPSETQQIIFIGM